MVTQFVTMEYIATHVYVALLLVVYGC